MEITLLASHKMKNLFLKFHASQKGPDKTYYLARSYLVVKKYRKSENFGIEIFCLLKFRRNNFSSLVKSTKSFCDGIPDINIFVHKFLL